MDKDTIDRFFSKVDKTSNPNGCWDWLGLKHPFGYGRFCANKQIYLAHRLSYIIAYGPITSSQCLLHKCDNPQCVNPEHLQIGTRRENARDRDKKNRTTKGQQCYNTKFTDQEVFEIKNSGLSIRELAKKYNSNYQTIWSIKKNVNWKHI